MNERTSYFGPRGKIARSGILQALDYSLQKNNIGFIYPHNFVSDAGAERRRTTHSFPCSVSTQNQGNGGEKFNLLRMIWSETADTNYFHTFNQSHGREI